MNRLSLLIPVAVLAIQPGPLAAEGEAQFLIDIRQLTFEGKRSGEGYFSADGKSLVFQSERDAENPFYQIFLLDLETGDSQRVSPGTGKTTCAFIRPRSDEVMFASTHHDPEARAKQKAELEFRASGKSRRYSWDYDATMDIFSARRNGTKLKQLTASAGYDAEGAYSPDGKKIVFCSLRSAYPTNKLSATDFRRLETDPAWFGEIYLMNADGSGQKRLTDSPGYDGGPFFSPDGRRIIWRHFNEDGTIANIHTMKLDGSDRRQLTDFGCMSWAPYFHPSGQYAIFTANKLGFANFELFLVDAAGTKEPVRVTFTDGFDGLPVFAPEGNRLCWTASRTADGKSQLFLARWNHAAALAALTAAPAREGGRAVPSAPHAQDESTSTAVRTPRPAMEAKPTPPKVPAAPTKFSPEITHADLRSAVAYLADDALDGRNTGTPGAQLAAAFAAELFKRAGLRPLGEGGKFFQNFPFTSGIKTVPGKNALDVRVEGGIVGELQFKPEEDFRPLSFTASESLEGEVVFAGYGLKVPDGNQRAYDSYAGLDVSNKIVLVLRYVPEEVEPKRRQELNVYAGLRYKAMIARERGAKGILVVTGPNSPNAGQLAPLSFDTSLSGSGIIAASVTEKVAKAILDSVGKDLKTLQAALDKEDPHADGGFALPRVKVRISTAVEQIRKQDQNVVAVLPPRGSTEYILVGAHYDHLGHGDGSSLSKAGEHGAIHNGADDNASGTAAVLELAAAFAAEEKKKNPGAIKRGLIFALWSGEEIGLIGSSHFAEKPAVPLSNIVAYVNFDMVGRLRDNKLSLQGVGSSSVWRKLIEKRNVAAGFNLALQEDPYLPTDTTAFYPRRIPVLNFFTGSHEDYHRPTDDTDKIEFEGLERITKLARGIVADLAGAADRPDYLSVARSDQGGGGREQLRAYLGSIPDYAQEVAGVKLSGVRGGSPAEKGGLKSGDIIVEFAGQKIKNIYDYTYALDAVKIGKAVEIVVERGTERVKLSVTPEARK